MASVAACGGEVLVASGNGGTGGSPDVGGRGGAGGREPTGPAVEDLRTYETSAWLTGIAVADDGSLYLSLVYHEGKSLYLGAPAFAGEPLTIFGEADFALVKLDPEGELVWARSFGGPRDDYLRGIGLAPNGDIMVCGSADGELDLGGGTVVPVDADVFVARFTPNGEHVWSRLHVEPEFNRATACAVDDAGSLFVSSFGGWGEPVLILVAYSSSGDLQWARYADADFGAIAAWDVALDQAGNPVVVGGFAGTVDAGFGPVTSEPRANGLALSFTGAGEPRWQHVVAGPDDLELYDVAATLGGLVVSGSGIVAPDYVQLDPLVRSLSTSGEAVWTWARPQDDLNVRSVVGSRVGGAWTAVARPWTEVPDGFVLRLDDAGQERSRIDYLGPSAVTLLERRDANTIAAGGWYEDGASIAGRRLDGRGIFLFAFADTQQ